MSKLFVPENYTPVIDYMESQRAIKKIKDFFQQELAYGLKLRRVSAPLFVAPETGLNDNLNGVERTVNFTVKDMDEKKQLSVMRVLIVVFIVISAALNKAMVLGTSRTEVKIVSEKSREIRDAILSRVDRGCTLLHGEGGYLHQPTEVIMSVVSNHELVKIEQLARQIDPNCFIIISHVTEVLGRGFTYGKKEVRK